MKSFAFVLLLLLPSTSSNLKSISKGTIVYYDFTPDEIIVAADSRDTSMNGSYSDSKCKIFGFGNENIFASTGVTHVVISHPTQKPIAWDSHDVAKRAFGRAGRTRGTQVAAFRAAQYWGAEAKRTFEPGLSEAPSEFMKLIAGNPFGIIEEAVFANVDPTGNLFLFYVVVKVTSKVGQRAAVTFAISQGHSESAPHAMGTLTVAKEFAAGSSSRARNERSRWYSSLTSSEREGNRFRELWAIQIVKWAVQYDRTKGVGGDADAVVLNSRGIHWLAKKEGCKATE